MISFIQSPAFVAYMSAFAILILCIVAVKVEDRKNSLA